MNNKELTILGKPEVMDIKPLDKFLVDTGICKSKREARDLLKSGGIYINKERVESEFKYIMLLDNCQWDINNKALWPHYLLTQDDFNKIVYGEQ